MTHPRSPIASASLYVTKRVLPLALAVAIPVALPIAVALAGATSLGCGATTTPPAGPPASGAPLTSDGGTALAASLAVRDAGPLASATPSASPTPAAKGGIPADWPYAADVTGATGATDARSDHAMVATDNALATHVGRDVLASGGNAVDAAIATAFALAVAFPTAGNIGGGGFLVARVGGASYALDFRETAPHASTRDMYLGADGKTTRDSRDGWRSVGVPGSVAGLYEAWRKIGSKRKTWPELLAPAIDLADRGFVVDAAFQKTIERVQDRLKKDAASSALYLPGGSLPVIGTTFRDPDLAAVLRKIAQQGPSGFYKGAVAETVAAAMKKGGGIVTADDLKTYKAKWRTPFEYAYRGHKVIGMPPPSSGGITVAMMANLLAAYDLHALGFHSPAEIHLVAEAMRRAFAARNATLGDPDFVKNPVETLTSAAWTEAQRKTIREDRATPTSELFGPATPTHEGPHTTHLSVVDGDGNAVAMTTTLNAWFGSGVMAPGLGFVLNDEMDDFATVPGTANMFGLVQKEPNAIAPGKRMLSSMSPTIVLGADGAAELVLGAAGGSRIITTVFQEMSNVLDFGMSVPDAVRAPRMHQQDSPDVIFFEPHGLPDDVRRALEAMGHATKEVEHIADGPAIGRLGKGWEGAAEPRRDGSLAEGL